MKIMQNICYVYSVLTKIIIIIITIIIKDDNILLLNIIFFNEIEKKVK